MNSKQHITLLLLFIVCLNTGRAQQINNDTISWNIDRYSILSELGKVNIDVKEGKNVKKAIITKIDTSRGKIEYYSEGCLHDLYMNKIYEISPVTPHQYSLYFNNNKYPIIRRSSLTEPYQNYIEFKYYVKPAKELPIKEDKSITLTTIKKDSSIVLKDTSVVKTQNVSVSKNSTDLIILPNGKKLEVKLIELTEETVSYKRIDLLDGPLYKISLNLPESTIKAKVINEVGRTIIDYYNKQ